MSRAKIVIAFAVGFVGGILATRSYLEKKYQEIAQEEIDSVKESIGRRRYIDESANSEDSDPSDVSEEKRQISLKNRYKQNLSLYRNNDEDQPYEEGRYATDHQTEPYNDIEVINVERFSEEAYNYDKLTIYYYRADDVLIDENEAIIDDVSSVIGDEALSYVDPEGEETQMIYVRNNKISIDYEIICLKDNYYPITGLEEGE